MDVISADNMQERGNFIALMFFVMALGLLVVFAITGWSTNVISQVSLLSFEVLIDMPIYKRAEI